MERINLSKFNELNTTWRLCEVNGPYPGDVTEIGTTYFSTMDCCKSQNNNPIRVPTEGHYYSFAKSIYFEVFNWNKFSDILGIDRIWDIALCMEDGVYSDGIEILALPSVPIKNYKQATGTIGVTGDCIVDKCNIRKFDKFSQQTPYIIGHGLFNGEFKTGLAIQQLKISPVATRGDLILPKFYVSGVID